MVERGETLAGLSGIGADLAGKIDEIARTGSCELVKRLRQEMPAAINELLKVPGMGPKRVKALWHRLACRHPSRCCGWRETGESADFTASARRGGGLPHDGDRRQRRPRTLPGRRLRARPQARAGASPQPRHHPLTRTIPAAKAAGATAQPAPRAPGVEVHELRLRVIADAAGTQRKCRVAKVGERDVDQPNIDRPRLAIAEVAQGPVDPRQRLRQVGISARVSHRQRFAGVGVPKRQRAKRRALRARARRHDEERASQECRPDPQHAPACWPIGRQYRRSASVFRRWGH